MIITYMSGGGGVWLNTLLIQEGRVNNGDTLETRKVFLLPRRAEIVISAEHQELPSGWLLVLTGAPKHMTAASPRLSCNNGSLFGF